MPSLGASASWRELFFILLDKIAACKYRVIQTEGINPGVLVLYLVDRQRRGYA